MAQAMQMDDAALIGKVWFDQLEWRAAARPGEAYSGRTQDARAELFWDHLFARWWSLQAGGREDFGTGPARSWAALGMRGLAPQGVAVEVTVYAGTAGRSAARLKIDYELLFTQRLVLTPELEVNVYGKADPERDIAAGVADLEIGLRLRYEVRREIAPYAGIVWVQRRGAGADAAHAATDSDELCVALGLRLWL
jgi:copper resistance protein B